MNTLHHFVYKKHFFADNGENGSSRNKHGKNGKDLVIDVPVGTLVFDKKSQELLCDLSRDGQTFIVAKGGRGGRGNRHFANSRERTPRYSEKGGSFEEKELELKLKMISHIGVVGAPNAGKSTLLSKVTNAKPTIADYPFTTLSPKIGVVDLGFEKRFIMADLPGLIEGAHSGKGMGNEFLSHIERTKVLLLLIDGSDRKSIKSTYKMLIGELSGYKEDLLNKRRIVVINKIDTWKNQRKKEIENFFKKVHEEVFFVSALEGKNIESLLERLYEIVKEEQSKEELREEEGVLVVSSVKTDRNALLIEKVSETTYRVKGDEIERRVALTDFGRYGSVNELLRYFDKIELEQQLKKQGAKEGDRIIIGEKSFILKEQQ